MTWRSRDRARGSRDETRGHVTEYDVTWRIYEKLGGGRYQVAALSYS